MPVAELVKVPCACGKRLKVPATAVGRKARCPACGNTMVVGASPATQAPATARRTAPPRPMVPAAKPAPAVKPAPADDDGLGALYELAEQANAVAPVADRPICPQCRSAMDDGVVVCMGCGYDARSGKTLGAAVLAKPGKQASRAPTGKFGTKPVDYMAPRGSFAVGFALSAAFAGVASILWIIVSLITVFGLVFASLAIGGAAGLGMVIGQKGYSRAGGSAASGLTLAAILFAKFAAIEIALAVIHPGKSITELNSMGLGFYFLSPIHLIIMAVGMGAAFRTANGSMSN